MYVVPAKFENNQYMVVALYGSNLHFQCYLSTTTFFSRLYWKWYCHRHCFVQTNKRTHYRLVAHGYSVFLSTSLTSISKLVDK